MPIRQTLGRQVKTLRERASLTQEQLAEKANITANHLYRIESGRVAPSIDTLERLAHALNIPIRDFFPN